MCQTLFYVIYLSFLPIIGIKTEQGTLCLQRKLESGASLEKTGLFKAPFIKTVCSTLRGVDTSCFLFYGKTLIPICKWQVNCEGCELQAWIARLNINLATITKHLLFILACQACSPGPFVVRLGAASCFRFRWPLLWWLVSHLMAFEKKQQQQQTFIEGTMEYCDCVCQSSIPGFCKGCALTRRFSSEFSSLMRKQTCLPWSKGKVVEKNKLCLRSPLNTFNSNST